MRSARLSHGWRAWDETGGVGRAAVLERAADLIEAARPEMLFLLAREAGRTLTDGDRRSARGRRFLPLVCRARARAFRRSARTPRPTGESNTWALGGRGVFACISPWNFPLSIFVGQVAAALAAGNAVAAKPAEQTPLIAARAVELLHQAGVPARRAASVAGRRHDRRGDRSSDPRIAGVAFTGGTDTARASRATWRRGPARSFRLSRRPAGSTR